MCVHTRAYIASFVQEEIKLCLITALILKAEHVLFFAELWPK